MWSAVSMVGYLRRCLSIATAYAEVRSINTPDGPRFLKEMPSHVAQLARIGLVYRALTHLIFGAVRLLGKVECNGKDARDRMRLRLLTPVCKAFAAEIGIGAMEEAMVCLGGQGYMEENQIGR
jgi:alkylation response protein AidB-like acyl-CoA dehydrogenase